MSLSSSLTSSSWTSFKTFHASKLPIFYWSKSDKLLCHLTCAGTGSLTIILKIFYLKLVFIFLYFVSTWHWWFKVSSHYQTFPNLKLLFETEYGLSKTSKLGWNIFHWADMWSSKKSQGLHVQYFTTLKRTNSLVMQPRKCWNERLFKLTMWYFSALPQSIFGCRWNSHQCLSFEAIV